jgi:hypothetical protein
MVSKLLRAVMVALILVPRPALPEFTEDLDLAAGIQLTKTGEFERAVVALDGAARRLSEEGGRPKELARAYVYLAIAYLGLSQEQQAKAKFMEAIRTDGAVNLSAQEFPPKVLQFFEAIKEAESSSVADQQPVAAEKERSSIEAKPPRSKTALIVVGVGGAVAAAGAVVASGSGDSPSTSGPTTAVSLAVPAAQGPPGLDSGIDVVGGRALVVTATGRARYGSEGDPTCSGLPETDPDGQRYLGTTRCSPRIDSASALAGAPVGTLIGRIGNGPWFAIGSNYSSTTTTSGRLFLMYNDTYFPDNEAGYSLQVRPQ